MMAGPRRGSKRAGGYLVPAGAAALLAACCLLGGGVRVSAQGSASREYAIKAACLFNFLRFVDWPAQALPDSSPTLTIGVLGKNPFGPALDTLNGKSVKGKTLVVRQVSGIREIQSCQVLFISASERDHLRQILEAVQGQSILTIGDVDGFTRNGGIINFTTDENKVRFEINPGAAERARLAVSSQLLKLAKIVKS